MDWSQIKFHMRDDVILNRIANTPCLIALEGAKNVPHFQTMNNTAAWIINKLKTNVQYGQLISLISEKYDLDPKNAENDLDLFLLYLYHDGYIIVEE